ncbi:MAG TPA: GNAT family N-acetyltransferase [Thiobacillus sp.]|nr:MAG: GNAT family N-acetyltransferase [Hydrogenophilales bacterium 28-61-11]OYZ56628.1 MAG: GNAT family N-acetyltransferase [Hydrogenophilales bacterium 16-61-112]OZA44119.1 MAG: GNAT family N-acetyltransferase [Hydrogenophilales bacterium 17-61-76]HQT30959.1 GNAT family N-acetyltransferase [Thiobacillus sp.]HQT70065.1 GNAT family N-acetyltransferase [Thiobacillus sp.]
MPAFLIHETDWAHDAAPLSAVRRAVFIDEQGVPEALEWDEQDAASLHLLATAADGGAIGCARLLPDGHIGRMAVLPAWRGQGVGRALLAAAIRAAQAHGHSALQLSAQIHAAGFYAEAGFVAEGEDYVEAGIPHVAMRIEFPQKRQG